MVDWAAGTVRFASNADPASMPNQGNRVLAPVFIGKYFLQRELDFNRVNFRCQTKPAGKTLHMRIDGPCRFTVCDTKHHVPRFSSDSR